MIVVDLQLGLVPCYQSLWSFTIDFRDAIATVFENRYNRIKEVLDQLIAQGTRIQKLYQQAFTVAGE